MVISPRAARIALPLVGVLSLLSACHTQPENIVAGETPDDQKAALEKAKPVELPPAILATKSYRCGDSSVVYVDWFSGDKTANVRTEKGGTPTMVKADEAGKPMIADGGYSVEGTSKSSSIKVLVPGHKGQSCNG